METFYIFTVEYSAQIGFAAIFALLVLCFLVLRIFIASGGATKTVPFATVVIFALAGFLFIDYFATDQLAARASTPTEVEDLSGVVVSLSVPGCSRCLLIESPREEGWRLAVSVRQASPIAVGDQATPIAVGDQVTLSALGTPKKQFRFPAICRAGSCWLVDWDSSITPDVCKASSSDICQI